MAKYTPVNLQDWMERTGTPTTTLAKLVGVDRTHLSRILTNSRRCSLVVALKLAEVTGVPVENLVEWPRVASGAPNEETV